MKSRAILWLMLCVAIGLIGCSTKEVTTTGPSLTPSGKTQISGSLPATLSLDGSPYWVTGDLSVDSGQTVTIMPGVELRFDDLSGQRYKMVVKGRLLAVGNANENIIFTSMSAALGAPDRGQWRTIVFDNAVDTSELAYCQIKYGAVWDSTQRYPDSTGLWMNGAIFCWNSSPLISKCTVVLSGYHGIYCIGYQSRPRIIDCNIAENDGDGVRCQPLPGQAALPIPDISYCNSQENNSRQWADCPAGIGDRITTNANGDSCDFQKNITMDPMYADMLTQNYTLNACSPLIRTASDGNAPGATIGSIPYYVGSTELRGNIDGYTLSANQSPWYVTCNVFVTAGNTLNVQPGALVLFESTFNLKIDGSLQADGAVFKPLDSNNVAAKWLGVTFNAGSGTDSYIRNCRFEKASTVSNAQPYTGAITLNSSHPEISGNVFLNSEYTAISCLQRSEPLIERNVIDGFGTIGINCYDNSHPTIRYNRIRNGKGYGILCQFTSLPLMNQI